MYLKKLELSGFKSFAKPTRLEFPNPVTAIVGPNGAGKSNIAEAMRWVLGEQSIKSLRGKKGEDLIFNGSQTAPRLGKGSVSLFLDNKNKNLAIDYDEVKITRKVFRDGINEYLLNDSRVRFRDIIELLSKIGIGTSNHHIISQGESDRILNASLKERRQMIEDALGLKIYQIKKTEAERKLEKTQENIKQVESLRKEIQPHLKFLRKQAEKAEESAALKGKLRNYYEEYLSNEEYYLRLEKEKINREKDRIEKEFTSLKKETGGTAEDSKTAELRKKINNYKEELDKKKLEINELHQKRNSVERDLGRLEGAIEAVGAKETEGGDEMISSKEARNFIEKLDGYIKKGLAEDNVERIKSILNGINDLMKEFSVKIESGAAVLSPELDELRKKQKETHDLLVKIEKQEKELVLQLNFLEEKINKEEQLLRDFEKRKYEIEGRMKELKGFLDNLNIKEDNFKAQKEELEREKQEAGAMVGKITDSLVNKLDLEKWMEERNKMRKEIERLKIKIEDSGGIGDEVLKEYEDVKKRDQFFEKELADLSQSIKSLRELLKELEEKIDHDFKEGVEKINKEFQLFFEAMFGGGKAELRKVAPKKRVKTPTIEDVGAPSSPDSIVGTLEGVGEEEMQEEEGIEGHVNLPKKRISSLDMLSGGERALTSIALLFAMSQVNPPPFLVLDETDAALDEANSQKYGNMLKDLSKRTQLVLITHNRETMKQAGVLYGITMGSDSISRLLSIKFSEAEKYTSG
ncbi:AAA family ATPase [Patescibacteria group bacterium]|nr:AAA family ATPase [Patescibacteria group bacterium]